MSKATCRNDVVLIRPTLAQALEQTGKWVVCSFNGGEGEAPYESEPHQITGVIVPAPGGLLAPQIMVDSWIGGIPDPCGFEYEIHLDQIRYMRIIANPKKGILSDHQTPLIDA